MNTLSNPKLATQRYNRNDGSYSLRVWCPWCESTHNHGMSDGHITAHCTPKACGLSASNSPLKGYETNIVSECDVKKDEKFPDKLKGRFHALMDLISTDLQQYFVKTLYGKRCCKQVQTLKFVDGTIVIVRALGFGDSDWYASLKGIQFKDGRCILSLISFLHAIPEGIAGVRILEILTNHVFDAQGKLEIADAINRDFERQALLKDA